MEKVEQLTGTSERHKYIGFSFTHVPGQKQGVSSISMDALPGRSGSRIVSGLNFTWLQHDNAGRLLWSRELTSEWADAITAHMICELGLATQTDYSSDNV